jgi:Tol biopolymer transport system component
MFLAWSPDESKIAVVTAPAGLCGDVNQLWVSELRTGRVSAVTDGRTKVGTPFWSPDGSQLYFVDNAGGNMDLWQQVVAGDGQPQGIRLAVTAGIGLRGASLSRDGRRLSYSQGRRVANVWRVPILADRRAMWSDAQQITFDQAFVEFLDVSHNGARLAVSSDRGGNHDLWILPSGGGDMRQVTSDPTPEWGPKWSPDDTTLAFFAFRTGNREMWTMPAGGGAWAQLTNNPGPDLWGAWSPDGQEVAHLTGRDGFTGLWVTPATGGVGRRVGPVAPSAGPGDWSLDGRNILTNVEQHIGLADAAGERAPVPVSKSRGFTPRFSADGSRIYFVAEDGNLWTVRPDGADERPVTDLTGRRGAPGISALATDGRYLYFTWEEGLGDLWTMDVHITG